MSKTWRIKQEEREKKSYSRHGPEVKDQEAFFLKTKNDFLQRSIHFLWSIFI